MFFAYMNKKLTFMSTDDFLIYNGKRANSHVICKKNDLIF